MRDARSRFAGLTERAARARLLAGGIATVAVLFLLAAVAFASPAGAAVIHKPAGSFDLPAGSPPPTAIAVDEQGGYIYVLGRFGAQIEKFDSAGNPSAFTGIPGPVEHQEVHFEGGWALGDAFTLTCPNAQPTAEIEWTEDHPTLESHIKAALESKCGIGVAVTGFDPYNSNIEYKGPIGHTDVPQTSCAKVSGTGTCYTTGGEDGAATTNKLNVACGNGCYQVTVDNSGGPNQGVIYVASGDSLTTCCPGNQSVPNPSGGIHAYLPSGQETHSQYKGVPVVRHPFEFEQGHDEPVGLGAGGLYTRSQEEQAVHACGVAVDGDGNLVIAHGDSNQEYAYFDKLGILPWASNDQQEGTLLGTLNSDTSSPCRVQIDSAGNVYYMAQTGGFEISFTSGPIKRYAPEFHPPSGTGPIPADARDHSTLFNEGPDVSFALDSEDHVYGLRPSGPPRVQQFDPTGSLTETFGAGELIEPADIAIDKATGTAYVTDGSFETAPDVHIFKAFTVPNSITGSFTATTQTTGVLNGEVDLAEAGEEATDCEFEFSSEALFIAKEFEEATKIPCEQGSKFTANAAVSGKVSGLSLEEPYEYRLVTENANGVSNGSVHQFIPHAVVDLTTKPASNVAPRSATLNASFDGNGDSTEYFFEIGHGPAGVYTESTPVQDAGAPSGATPLSVPVSGLQLETTYHYRVVATNGTGTSRGFDQAFTTLPAVSGLTTEPATSIDQETITLNGRFNGDGLDTQYFFEYGPTRSYGLLSGEDPLDAGSTSGPTQVSSEISTFYGYTTYHYRVVAKNSLGTTYGKDMTFTTEPAPKPVVSATRVDGLTPTTANVSALVTPNRWDASWLFEWGETTSYGSLTETEPILNGITTQSYPISATITGLEPGTVYHFRAVAFNFTGATQGADVTFKTPSAPRIDTSSASAVSRTTAHLAARVLSNESATDVHFEFGPGSGYGQSTPAASIGSDALSRESAADLTGLLPGTTYHYRVVATNRFGTTDGPDETFTTLPALSGSTTNPPAKCPKGKARKHGKCVPKHKRHRGHKKKKTGKKGKRHGRSR